jgi:5-methyltetrahydrofolate--homocysteine methyltransferase
MKEVGTKHENGDFFVPEMLISARAMQTGLGLLKPILSSAEVKSSGKVAIGIVFGDLHDIGKNLVGMILEGAGFELIDLGTDVSPGKFVQAVQEHHPKIIAMSALLTTTMPSMKKTIDSLTLAGLRNQVKVIIGGAPFSKKYAGDIGADGYASDASRAVNLSQTLCQV